MYLPILVRVRGQRISTTEPNLVANLVVNERQLVADIEDDAEGKGDNEDEYEDDGGDNFDGIGNEGSNDYEHNHDNRVSQVSKERFTRMRI